VTHASLAPHGRLVCLESCFLLRQAPLSRWLVSRDRGKNVRYEYEWKALVAKVFERFETHILTGHIRIPYTLIVIEAYDEKLHLASRNLANVDVRTVASLDPLSLARYPKVLATVGALRMLEEKLA